jgi:predicted GTPase
VEELNKDDVPPEAHGAVEKYFAAYERNVLATKLQEKETKQERKQAVTEGKSVVSLEHFPDDPNEALKLLRENPGKYEELAKKAGLRE